MKRITSLSIMAAMLFLYAHISAGTVSAACNMTMGGDGTITAATCGVDGQSTEAYDYTACPGDDSTNASVLTINTGTTITLNAGSSGTPTKLIVGRISSPGTGRIVATADYVTILSGSTDKCYVVDSDGDGYSPSPNTCSSTGGAGYVRRRCLTGTQVDCSDATNLAYYGAPTYRTGSFNNTKLNDPTSWDWNCNDTEEQQYSTATYTCTACTNGSGYASTINSTSGFQTSVPACGNGGTYYTVSNATCRDPAVASCTGSYTTSTVTQACR